VRAEERRAADPARAAERTARMYRSMAGVDCGGAWAGGGGRGSVGEGGGEEGGGGGASAGAFERTAEDAVARAWAEERTEEAQEDGGGGEIRQPGGVDAAKCEKWLSPELA
jgi:hypothetical protein